jgi:hypothetical protein
MAPDRARLLVKLQSAESGTCRQSLISRAAEDKPNQEPGQKRKHPEQ